MKQHFKSSIGSIAGLMLAWTLVSASPAFGAANLCMQMFAPNSILERHELIKTRALAIIEHQNSLRLEAGLRLFELKDYQANLRKKPPTTITSDSRYIVVKRELVLIEMTDKIASTALLVDDVHSLNYVYHFEGPKLVEAIPAAIYYLSQMPEVVRLTRGLSSAEARLWEAGDLASLRSHPKAIRWGYPEPVAHFAVRQFHQTGMPTITANVPRDILLNWARRRMITIGSEGDLNGKPAAIEIVIKHRVWDELLSYLP